MSHAMDREEFDEVIDAISQIQGKTIKLERALRLLKSKNPDSRLKVPQAPSTAIAVPLPPGGRLL